jgi:hypothetical protein
MSIRINNNVKQEQNKKLGDFMGVYYNELKKDNNIDG